MTNQQLLGWMLALAGVVVMGFAVWYLAFPATAPQIPDTGIENGVINGDAENGQQNGDGSGNVPSGYVLYTNADLNFSLFRPSGSTAQGEGGGIKFMYLGPDAQPNTEITDGFTLTVRREATNEEGPLEYARSVYESVQASEENTITRGLEERRVSDMTAYRFSYRGALGTEITEYIFLPFSNTGYRATYSIADPQRHGYQDMVFTMLESISFSANGPPVFTRVVEIALLDTEGDSAGPMRGCDKVVMIERMISPTRAPLTAAMQELFRIEQEQVNGWYNFVARTNDTLSFDRATVLNGTAHVYLLGDLSGLAGVCDDPRARIQIEETALQFPTVERVQLYLNGAPTDLQPDQQ